MDTKSLDKLIPQIAKDRTEIDRLREIVTFRETWHHIHVMDARNISIIPNNSVHLVVTSPPYWNLKKYNETPHQLGHIHDYQKFLEQLDIVWRQCFDKLVKGGRMVVVVGDVLLSRRQFGRHKVVPLHADIQVRCEKIGFDNLAPIFWYKISNASFEVKGNSKFLGKPYEPNGIIKHDIEYLLMLRKPGSYRKPSHEQRKLSVISEIEFNKWYTQIWRLNGTSTRNHPAPYPEELAERLIRMFSFVDDTVMDPFLGSGTTMVAAMKTGRNSIGVEIDKDYAKYALNRLNNEVGLFGNGNIKIGLKENENEFAAATGF